LTIIIQIDPIKTGEVMAAKKIFPRMVSAMLSALMILSGLIVSSAFPTNVRAFSNTIQVTTTADTALVDSQCSLREAIINADTNAVTYPECLFGATGNFIAFDTGLGAATITLTSTLPAISDPAGLTIYGGGQITISGNNSHRVFTVNSGAPLTLDGLTITNGLAVSLCSGTDGLGGGVYNAGTLIIQDSTFSNNSAVYQSACGGNGGGVYNTGTVAIINSTFSSNTAGQSGGGVYNSGALTIARSTFLSNTSNGGYGGGGVFNFGNLTISNSTFALDVGFAKGGGLYNHTGIATLTNNTFSANSAAIGGDIYNDFAALNLYNTILANSLGGGDCFNNAGTVNAVYNINEDIINKCNLPIGPGGNTLGTDPGLAPIYFPPGSPGYFPLPVNSFPIDLGDDAKCAAAPVSNTSQNGLSRPQGAHCDIGSYERDSTVPVVLSSMRVDPDPTTAASINFTVTFSEPVTGVDTGDFSVSTTGTISGASVTTAVGSGTSSLVTVSTGSGAGTIRLNVIDNNSIMDATSNPLGGAVAGDGNFTSGEIYTVNKTWIFADVTNTYWAVTSIEKLYNAGITGGCATVPLKYCPTNAVTRTQMAIFLVRAKHGVAFIPPTATGIFPDVPIGSFGANYIEQLYTDGITSGCGGGNYCPNTSVSRAQMAVFLVRAKHGSTFIPPVATGIFPDVPVGSFGANYIEQLVADSITSGCGGGNYCPNTMVKRDSMAVFLVKTFGLP
jgi:CSLREA domain-containing protein